MPKYSILGNWKMNQSLGDIETFIAHIQDQDFPQDNLLFGIAPQAIHIPMLCQSKKRIPQLKVGAQNCSFEDSGAFTGELSPLALKEIGVDFLLIGHSERRELFHESDEQIRKKVQAVIKHQMIAVLCIGETLEQREAGKTKSVVIGQLKAALKDIKLQDSSQLIVAYEPIWAIGTGKTASAAEAQEVHAWIREELFSQFQSVGRDIGILYGGSVKPDNASELLGQQEINGALVGGASLKAQDFLKICQAIK